MDIICAILIFTFRYQCYFVIISLSSKYIKKILLIIYKILTDFVNKNLKISEISLSIISRILNVKFKNNLKY